MVCMAVVMMAYIVYMHVYDPAMTFINKAEDRYDPANDFSFPQMFGLGFVSWIMALFALSYVADRMGYLTDLIQMSLVGIIALLPAVLVPFGLVRAMIKLLRPDAQFKSWYRVELSYAGRKRFSFA